MPDLRTRDPDLHSRGLCSFSGSTVAFAVTEGLKPRERPITPIEITKVFSPVCRCSQAHDIAFKLRKRDTITLTIVGAHGKEIRRLVDHRRLNHGPHHFTWNGRNAAGKELLAGVTDLRGRRVACCGG
jgi:hypothetical protein